MAIDEKEAQNSVRAVYRPPFVHFLLKVDSGKPIAKGIDAVDQWQFVNNKQYLL